MIYKKITLQSFQEAFEIQRPGQFSEEGLKVLFYHLEDLNGDIELDVIDICCSWSEYDSMDDLLKEFPEINLDEFFSLTASNGHILISC